MIIAQKNGTKFEFEFLSFGRGQWSIRLVRVNGNIVSDTVSDPDYPTEREARRVARTNIEGWYRDPTYGWCL